MPRRITFTAALLLSGALHGQHGSTAKANPFNTPTDVAEGARMFRSHCAACHGPVGQGGAAGPDLTTGSFKRSNSDEALFGIISKGIPGTTMPAFSGSGQQVWQLAAYVRTLSVGRAAERAKGNVAAGSKLYQSAGCAKCHDGGLGGPDLSDVGTRRSLAELHRSLIDPDAEVHPDYWRLSARTVKGEQIGGIRTNEDTFSYQYRQGARLLSVLKRDLASHEIVRTSPMPSYRGKLTPAELDNVIAWLAAQRGSESRPSAEAALVPYERLRNAEKEPGNWLTYNGSYASTHYRDLTQITPENASRLRLEWVHQARSLEKFEPNPLVVDGVMYLTEPPSTIVALDARTGRVHWTYQHQVPAITYPCCGKVNRGLAILDNTLYMGTIDAKLIAVDAATGRKKWETTVADYTKGYAVTAAPLAVKDRIIVGPAGGELGIVGFIAAYDAKTGRQLWKFNTIPHPGEPGHESWGGDSWKHGGAPIWLTGSYDPELNLTYWGTGNPGPDWNPDVRPGDNLYSSSVVALDADTGRLKWHFQFTPHDEWDWDSVQVPVLADLQWKGARRKTMLWGNRNGFFYVLDRVTGEFLAGTPFVKQTWAKGLDERGRPIRIPNAGPTADGNEVWPGVQSGTNWYAPSFSPNTGLFYLTAWDEYPGTYFKWHQEYEQGKWYAGGAVKAAVPATSRTAQYKRAREAGYSVVRALNPQTGGKVWDFPRTDMSESGLLTTSTDLLFSGNREGYFLVLHARTGQLLWKRYLGGAILSSPITYLVDDRQMISIAGGNSIFTFSLPE